MNRSSKKISRLPLVLLAVAVFSVPVFFFTSKALGYWSEGKTVFARNGETVELSVYPQLLSEHRKQRVVLTIPNYPPDKIFRFVDPVKYPNIYTWEPGDYTAKIVKIKIVSDYDGEDESMILKLVNVEGDTMPILADRDFAEIKTQGDAGAARCEGGFVATGGVPEGYGPPFNMLSAGRETLLTVLCSSEGIKAVAGNAALKTLVYKTGLVSVGGEWREVSFDGVPAPGNPEWFEGTASADLPDPVSEESGFVTAFICHFDGGSWKCGCSDGACATNHWVIQKYRR